MNDQTLVIIGRLNGLKAKYKKFGDWEFDKSYELQQLIRERARMSDEILMLEQDLAKLREKVKANPMVDYANKLLKGMFP